MGLFDRFKKQAPKSGAPDPAPEQPVETSAAQTVPPVPQIHQQALEHQNSGSAPAGKAPGPVQRSGGRLAGPGPSRAANQQQIWPRLGSSVQELIGNQQLRVFVTADFVRSASFAGFAQDWHSRRVGALVTRFYFLPDCEKLADEEKTLINSEDCRTRQGDSPAECMAALAAQKLRWNIVLLTASAQTGYVWQQAAKENGVWLRWYGLDKEGKLCSLQQKAEPRQSNATAQRIFQHEEVPARISRVQAYCTNIPAAGGTVYLQQTQQALRLGKPVMSDHRSITYSTSEPEYFAKIFTAASLQVDLFENKITRMLRSPVKIPGVCWPKDILIGADHRFVGVLVPASKGVQLTASVLNGATGLAQYFPKWDKRDLCQLCVTILQMISQLEALGLLVGCLNPATIYVADPKTVYFVDMDNWQVEGYPGLSRNRTFTAPELLQMEKPPILSNLDWEYYQVAMLTFLLLMPGKFPYSKRRSTSDIDSIVSMSFPFTIDSDRQRSRDAERPSGVWRIVWDHLSYLLCVQFYNSFHANGKNAKPGTRIPTAEWLRLVNAYAKSLETPERADSRAMFPRTFRRDGKRVFFRCGICGQEHPQSYFLRSIYINQERVDLWSRGYRVCLPCAEDKSDMSFQCQCCGDTYYYTNRTKIMHEIGRADYDFKAQKWCRNCKKRTATCTVCGQAVPLTQMVEFNDRRRNQTRTMCSSCKSKAIAAEKQWKEEIWNTKLCKNCGRWFSITNGEYEYLTSKGYSIPTRCKICRGRR